jgi:hypothetical protein
MKAGRSLSQLAAEIERRALVKKDFIADTRRISISDDAKRILLDAPNAAGIDTNAHFGINEHAHNQFAEMLDMPTKYYKRMRDDHPDLLAHSVNALLQREPSRRMIRTLDGTARAFLSDKYRPLDNEDLAEAILPVLLQRNLIIMSCEITDTRLYIKAVDRDIQKDIPNGRAMGDGTHTIFDTVSPAIIVSNSEVGAGAVAIEAGVWTKACTNLAIFGASMRKYHTGQRAAISDEVYALLTDKTKQMTDEAVWAQTRDLVASAFDNAKFEATCKKLGDATQDRIETDPVGVIEVVGKRLNLLEGERKGILASLIEGADLSRYGVHSAITHFSQKVADYDRATELERAGAKVIDLSRADWAGINKAAA